MTVERPLRLQGIDSNRAYTPKEIKALKESSQRDKAAPPIIHKIHKKGVAADPLHGLFVTAVDGKPAVEVSEQATDTARRILAMREVHRHAITETLGRTAGNGHRVLDTLYENPIVSVKEVQRLIGTTYPAANNLVGCLQACRILEEITGQARHRRFAYQSYIRLFHDDTEPAQC